MLTDFTIALYAAEDVRLTLLDAYKNAAQWATSHGSSRRPSLTRQPSFNSKEGNLAVSFF
jgi:hypothetical protein